MERAALALRSLAEPPDGWQREGSGTSSSTWRGCPAPQPWDGSAASSPTCSPKPSRRGQAAASASWDTGHAEAAEDMSATNATAAAGPASATAASARATTATGETAGHAKGRSRTHPVADASAAETRGGASIAITRLASPRGSTGALGESHGPQPAQPSAKLGNCWAEPGPSAGLRRPLPKKWPTLLAAKWPHCRARP